MLELILLILIIAVAIAIAPYVLPVIGWIIGIIIFSLVVGSIIAIAKKAYFGLKNVTFQSIKESMFPESESVPLLKKQEWTWIIILIELILVSVAAIYFFYLINS
jgi:hypothetical protein